MAPLLLTIFLFLLVVGGMTFAGLKFWARPKEAMDRVSGVSADITQVAPSHPGLVFQDLLKKIGTILPENPKDVTVMQRKLIRGGYRGPNALAYLYGAKAALGILFPVITFFAISGNSMDPVMKLLAIGGGAAAGFFAPNEWVKIAGKRRQKEVQKGLSNALDLLVVCVESGLGLDQAIMQVAKELQSAHPEISEEFAIVNYELKAGKRRMEALRNLADRCGVNDLKKLVAVLIQADRFGTGIAQSLRGHAEYMRVQARQIAEEKAAKLGVKLVFPIFFCILPSLFVITVGPMAMKIIRELIPMMNSFK